METVIITSWNQNDDKLIIVGILKLHDTHLTVAMTPLPIIIIIIIKTTTKIH